MASSAKRVLVGVLALGLVAGAHALERPSVFSSLSYGEAKTTAENSSRLFIVNAYVPWSSACRRMDRATWTDETLGEWLAANAVIVQFNVERERGLVKKLNIENMPTIIVFENGKEFDRIVGERSPQQMLAWLQGVSRGQKMSDLLRQAERDDARVDVGRRWEIARALVRSGDFDDAAQEYAWLWDNILKHDPSKMGARLGAMATEMQGLIAKHAPARDVFAAMRERDGSAMVSGEADRARIIDWVNLNRILGDERATLDWFDRAYANPNERHLVSAVDGYLFGLLLERERWSDAGRVLTDPVGYVRKGLSQPISMGGRDVPAPLKETLARVQRQQSYDRLSRVYAACLAAGRDDDARRVADVLLSEQDDAVVRLQLVRSALDADSPRRQHLSWLDQAHARGMSDRKLQSEVKQALAQAGQ